MIRQFPSLPFAITWGLAFWLKCAGSTYAQALPNLSVNLNANGKVHITWTMPTVSSILQEASSLKNTGAGQASPLKVITNSGQCHAGHRPDGHRVVCAHSGLDWCFARTLVPAVHLHQKPVTL
jgi:hypothetical protein